MESTLIEAGVAPDEALTQRRARRLPGKAATLLFTAFMTVAGVPVQAGPQGGQVVAGDGYINRAGGNTTLISQQSSRLSIRWDSFNVRANERVVFDQPSSQATVLNRIMDQNPSQIFGAIDANGRVFLINPYGIVFGETAQIRLGSLVASTLDISSEDFMRGNYDLKALADRAGGLIVNRGLIEAATGGSVALVGGAVANEGVIVADYGTVNLAAGRSATVDFDGDGLMLFEIDEAVLDAPDDVADAVANSGSIRADGGRVLLSASTARDVFDNAVNNTGYIRATRIENVGGEVRLAGPGGTVRHSGRIDVSGERGGRVEITGEQVGLFGDATIDASGMDAGGRVYVGGGQQGLNPDIANAAATYVGADASISADALYDGNGGRIIVYADETARIHGNLAARGGAEGGRGGFIETSGKGYLNVTKTPEIAGERGRGGTWLIDPYDITIVATDDVMTGINGASPFESTADDSMLGVNLIATALMDAPGATVTITTGAGGTNDDGDIVWALGAILDYHTLSTGAAADTLELNALNDIIFEAGSQIFDSDLTDGNNDQLNLTLNAERNITMGGIIDLGAGQLTATFGTDATTPGGTISIGSPGVVLPTANGYVNADAVVLTGGSGADTFNLNQTLNGLGSDTIDGIYTVNGMGGNDIVGVRANIRGVLSGDADDDRFAIIGGATVTSTTGAAVQGGAGNDILDFTGNNIPAIVTLSSVDADGYSGNVATSLVAPAAGFSGILDIRGANQPGNDTVTGLNAATSWTLGETANLSAQFMGSPVLLLMSNIEAFVGGSAIDTFNFNAPINTQVNGGDGGDIFNIGDAVSGNLIGGAGADVFNLQSGGSVAADSGIAIDGGADADTLSYAGFGAAATTVLTSSAANGFAGTSTALSTTGADPFAGIDTLTGSTLGDSLTGDNATAIWALDGTPTYAIGAQVLNFSAYESLAGGTGIDTFNISAASSAVVDGMGGADIFNISATLTGNLLGGTGADEFNMLAGGSVVATGVAAIDGGADNDTLSYASFGAGATTAVTSAAAAGFSGTSSGLSASGASPFAGINTLTGNAATDTLTGANATAIWGLDTARTYQLSGQTLNYSSYETLMAGTGSDTFNIDAAYAGTLSGGAGADIFNIAAAVTGNLLGGAGADQFNLMTGGSVAATGVAAIDGGTDADTLSYAGFGATTIALLAGTSGNAGTSATGLSSTVANVFDGIDAVAGSGAADVFNINGAIIGTIDGAGGIDEFNIAAAVTGSLAGGAGNDEFNIAAAVTGSLAGAAGNDSFNLLPGGSVAATGIAAIDGGAGADTLSYAGFGAAATVLTSASANGFSGTSTGLTASGASPFAGIDTLTGNAATDALTGANATAIWGLDGTPTYQLSGQTLNYTSYETLTAGSGSDTFNISAALVGSLDGGAGVDIFNIAAAVTGSLTGGAGDDIFNIAAAVAGSLTGAAGNDVFNMQAGGSVDATGTAAIIGGADSDTLSYAGFGAAVAPAFTSSGIDGNAGTSTGLSTNAANGFEGIDVFTGSALNDTFTVSGIFSGTINGAGGNDIFGINSAFSGFLNGDDGNDEFNVAAAVSGNLTGGAGDDIFRMMTGGSVAATIEVAAIDGGAGSDTLSYAGLAGNVTTTVAGADGEGFAGESTQLSTTSSDAFDGIDTLVGGAVAEFQGADTAAIWELGATPTYQLGGNILSISGYDMLMAGADSDIVNINTAYIGFFDGNDGADIFNINATVDGVLSGNAGNDVFNVAAAVTGSLNGGADNDSFNMLSGGSVNATGVAAIVGGAGSDTLSYSGFGAATTIDFLATAANGNAGTATGVSSTAANAFEQINVAQGSALGDAFNVNGAFDGTINGNAGDDVFSFAAAAAGTFDGAGDNDSFIIDAAVAGPISGGDGDDSFNIGAAVTGSVSGGDGDDSFNLQAGGSVAATGEAAIVAGAGNDTLSYAGFGAATSTALTSIAANGFAGTASGLSSSEPESFSGINTLAGGAASDTLTGLNEASVWALDGTPTYTSGGQILGFSGYELLAGGSAVDTILISAAFTGALDSGGSADAFVIGAAVTGNLIGGAGNDTFNMQPGGSVSATGVAAIDGGDGDDLLTYGGFNTALTATLLGNSAAGFDGTATGLATTATNGFQGIRSLVGNSSAALVDTLVGQDLASIWTIDTATTYAAGGQTLMFSAFESLTGGTAVDTVNIAAGSDFGVTGTLATGAGDDVVNIAFDGSASRMINLDAGAGDDVVALSGGAAGASADYSLQADTATHALGGNSQVTALTGVERVEDAVTADAATLTGSSGDDVMTLTAGTTSGNTPLSIAVAGAQTIDLANKTDVTIDGDDGNDSLTVAGAAAVPGTLTLALESLSGSAGGTLSATILRIIGAALVGSDAQALLTNVAQLELSNLTGVAFISETDELELLASQSSSDVSVTTGGNLSQSGALQIAGTTTLAATGGASVVLADAANDFGTVTISEAGAATIVDSNSLIVGGANISGALSAMAAGTMELTGAIQAATAVLNATGGALSQMTGTAGITAASLEATAASGIALDGNNAVDSLVASVTGDGDLSLNNDSSLLTLNGLSVTGSDITVTNTGAISVASAIAGADGTTTLNAGGTIGGAAGVVAGTLMTSSVGGTTMTTGNNVSAFGATNSGSGDIQFTNTGSNLTVNGISQSGGGSLMVGSAGGMTVGAAVAVAGGGAAMFDATGDLMQTAAIMTSGGNIGLTAGGSVGMNGANMTGGGNLDATAGSTLTQAGVISTSGGNVTANAQTGITMATSASAASGNGDISYCTVSGDVALGSLTAGTGDVSVKITGGGVFDIFSAGSSLSAVLSGNSVTLWAANKFGRPGQELRVEAPAGDAGVVTYRGSTDRDNVFNANNTTEKFLRADGTVIDPSTVADSLQDVSRRNVAAVSQAGGLLSVGYVDPATFKVGTIIGISDEGAALPCDQLEDETDRCP